MPGRAANQQDDAPSPGAGNAVLVVGDGSTLDKFFGLIQAILGTSIRKYNKDVTADQMDMCARAISGTSTPEDWLQRLLEHRAKGGRQLFGLEDQPADRYRDGLPRLPALLREDADCT